MISRFRLYIVLALSGMVATGAFAQEPQRAISNVKGDVYRFQNNLHFSLVVVTNDGVVVADPINADASAWLRDNLSLITDKPISHLIYSHFLGDHASGGVNLLAEGVQVIAQSNAPETIDGVAPTIRFDNEMSFVHGGKAFELTWLGEGLGTDLIAVVVRPENVAFIVDAASPKRLPFRDMAGADIDGLIGQIRKIESLDFEVFAPGHGQVGVKADATDVRVYMETLRTDVLTGLLNGDSVDELVDTLTMVAYKDWDQYEDWLEPNIRGMARFLKDSGQVE